MGGVVAGCFMKTLSPGLMAYRELVLQPCHLLVPSQPWQHLPGALIRSPHPQDPCSPASFLASASSFSTVTPLTPNPHTASSSAGIQQEITARQLTPPPEHSV